MTEWEGVLPLWKERGLTSHDCVAKARKLLRMKRIGHTGTLDPDVSGVLPLCLGRATRIVEYIQEHPKTYEAEMMLGVATDTEDASGSEIERVEGFSVSVAEIQRTFASFVGEIEQTPPMYSAVKVNGQRLYDLARAGVNVERKPRRVTIYSLEIRHINTRLPLPTVQFTVTCSKGTYIRTLCTDIGKMLGLPAHMSSLTRTASGGIRQEHCITFEEAERLLSAGELAPRLISIADALSPMPLGSVADDMLNRALQGQKLPFHTVKAELEDGALFRLMGTAPVEGQDRLIGIYQADFSSQHFIPLKIFT